MGFNSGLLAWARGWGACQQSHFWQNREEKGRPVFVVLCESFFIGHSFSCNWDETFHE